MTASQERRKQPARTAEQKAARKQATDAKKAAWLQEQKQAEDRSAAYEAQQRAADLSAVALAKVEASVSTAETKCAKWRRESVPVGLREKG